MREFIQVYVHHPWLLARHVLALVAIIYALVQIGKHPGPSICIIIAGLASLAGFAAWVVFTVSFDNQVYLALDFLSAVLLYVGVFGWRSRNKRVNWASVPQRTDVSAAQAGFGNREAFEYQRHTALQGETRMESNDRTSTAEPMTVTRALFSFEGRMRRQDFWLKYWLLMLPFGILSNVMYAYAAAEENEGALAVSFLISLLTLWPNLAANVKRLHDHNHSGWFLATVLIPLAGIVFSLIILVEVMFLRGTVGPNRFGADPVWDDYSNQQARTMPMS